jgi:hypothetical protein
MTISRLGIVAGTEGLPVISRVVTRDDTLGACAGALAVASEHAGRNHGHRGQVAMSGGDGGSNGEPDPTAANAVLCGKNG